MFDKHHTTGEDGRMSRAERFKDAVWAMRRYRKLKDIAPLLGVDRTTISRYTGDHGVPSETLVLLAERVAKEIADGAC